MSLDVKDVWQRKSIHFSKCNDKSILYPIILFTWNGLSSSFATLPHSRGMLREIESICVNGDGLIYILYQVIFQFQTIANHFDRCNSSESKFSHLTISIECTFLLRISHDSVFAVWGGRRQRCSKWHIHDTFHHHHQHHMTSMYNNRLKWKWKAFLLH